MIVPAGHAPVEGEAVCAQPHRHAQVTVLAAGLELGADGHLEIGDRAQAHLVRVRVRVRVRVTVDPELNPNPRA